MSDDSLSQNQVESLLKAMEDAQPVDSGGVQAPPTPGEVGAAGPGPPKFSSEESPTVGSAPRSRAGLKSDVRVSAYDFKRPERVGKEQMRSVQTLHESLARNFGASISGMLRTMIEVNLVSVDQLTYSEFIFGLDNPSCFSVLGISPLEGNWVLDIAPALSYAIIDRMLGGDPDPNEAIRRPLTEIENRLIGRVVKLFMEQLSVAWENIVDLQLSIEKVESNPQLVQIVPPNEVVILIGFEVLVGKNRGMFNLCIPYNTIENYNQQLSRNGWVGYSKPDPDDQSRDLMSRNVNSAPLDVVVTLARSRIRAADLLDLAVGDIITTETEVTTPLELSVQEVSKFRAKPGALKGKKAVKIETLVHD
ncbi:MAG: flagellar motor switch protein FliM [Planctomycetota bacterium]